MCVLSSPPAGYQPPTSYTMQNWNVHLVYRRYSSTRDEEKKHRQTGWNGLRQQRVWEHSDLDAESKSESAKHFPHLLWNTSEKKRAQTLWSHTEVHQLLQASISLLSGENLISPGPSWRPVHLWYYPMNFERVSWWALGNGKCSQLVGEHLILWVSLKAWNIQGETRFLPDSDDLTSFKAPFLTCQ